MRSGCLRGHIVDPCRVKPVFLAAALGGITIGEDGEGAQGIRDAENLLDFPHALFEGRDAEPDAAKTLAVCLESEVFHGDGEVNLRVSRGPARLAVGGDDRGGRVLCAARVGADL